MVKRSKGVSDRKNKEKGLVFSVKKYPFFFAALVVGIVFVALFFSLPFVDFESGNALRQQAIQLSQENQAYLDYVSSSATEEAEGATGLTREHYNSFAEDVSWLRERENKILSSFGDAYSKEVALSLGMGVIISGAQNSFFDLSEINYNSLLERALNANPPQFVSLEEFFSYYGTEDEDALNSALKNETMKESIVLELNSLLRDYFSKKKAILVSGSFSEDKKYVEAKKILFLSYIKQE